MPRHELRANVRLSNIPLSIKFYSYFVMIFIYLSFRPRDHGMIQFLSEGPLDSAKSVFFALGVYKCAC